jgi:hypothetical protein
MLVWLSKNYLWIDCRVDSLPFLSSRLWLYCKKMDKWPIFIVGSCLLFIVIILLHTHTHSHIFSLSLSLSLSLNSSNQLLSSSLSHPLFLSHFLFLVFWLPIPLPISFSPPTLSLPVLLYFNTYSSLNPSANCTFICIRTNNSNKIIVLK